MKKIRINLKNVAMTVACFAVVILLSVSCKKEISKNDKNNNPIENYVDDRVIHETVESEILSGIVELEGIVKVDVPNGVFSTKQNVTVSRITSVALTKIFEEMAEFYDVAGCLPYFVSVICQTFPNSDETFVTFTVPSDFAQKIPSNHTLNLFAQNYQVGEDELLDYFEPLEANYDDANKTVSVKLPSYAFSNEMNQNQYEAIMTLAATPRYNKKSECAGLEIFYPICNPVITSKYGFRKHPITGKLNSWHNGIDFKAKTGGNIFTVDDGVILKIGRDERIENGKRLGAGIYIIVKHDNGAKSSYCHLSSTSPVKKGDRVTTGQLIAKAGSTGGSTGPHLHFVYRANGVVSIDPLPIMIDRIESATVQYRLPGGDILNFSFSNKGLQWRQEGEDYIIICDGGACTYIDKETGDTQNMPAGSEKLGYNWMLDPSAPALTSNEMWSFLPGGTQTSEKIAGEWCVAYSALGAVHGIWKNTVYVRVGIPGEEIEAISITRGAKANAFDTNLAIRTRK